MTNINLIQSVWSGSSKAVITIGVMCTWDDAFPLWLSG